MSSDAYMLIGFILGLMFTFPAYFYGKAKGVQWATDKARELFRKYGVNIDD